MCYNLLCKSKIEEDIKRIISFMNNIKNLINVNLSKYLV